MFTNSIYTFNGIDTDHLVRQAGRVPRSNILVEKAYTYDALGNMLSRKTGYGTLASETAIAPITEAFQYDKINRLTGYQMVGGCLAAILTPKFSMTELAILPLNRM